MRHEIEQKLINYYKTSGCDRYGQLRTISAEQIAKTDEEMDILKQIVNVNTYGYTYGTYLGFVPWGAFKDDHVERMCREAFAQNPSRNNGNHW